MLGVGRDLCGSSSPTPLPKQGHLEQARQDLVQAGFEYLHNLPGQPVPVLCHPQREEVLPHVQVELPVLQFMPVAPCPVNFLEQNVISAFISSKQQSPDLLPISLYLEYQNEMWMSM